MYWSIRWLVLHTLDAHWITKTISDIASKSRSCCRDWSLITWGGGGGGLQNGRGACEIILLQKGGWKRF